MARTFSTPRAFKTSLEDRLKLRSRTTGVDLHRIRQLLIMERFLVRVFQYFDERAILKGGLVLELRLEQARATKDVDLGLKGNPQELLTQLQELGRIESGDFLTFETRADLKHPEILAEGMVYQGFRYKVQAYLAGKVYGSPYGVDIAMAEPIFGEPEILTGSSELSFAGLAPPEFRVYPLETHLSEKLHAYTMPRPRPNSRVKDLPDIALIGTLKEFQAIDLREAIRWTFRHRTSHERPHQLPPPSDDWGPVYVKMAKANSLPWSTLDEVYQAARTFMDPVLEGSAGFWSPTDWKWSTP